VLENIVRFIEEKGMKPFPAAVLATREIGLAVLATTLSLIAVFMPGRLHGGIPAASSRSFGVTMASPSPCRSSSASRSRPCWRRAGSSRSERAGEKKPLLTRVVDVFYRPIERGYVAMLR
jgi:HAE1 family hydrophobic/amphiphilic exporter-1